VIKRKHCYNIGMVDIVGPNQGPGKAVSSGMNPPQPKAEQTIQKFKTPDMAAAEDRLTGTVENAPKPPGSTITSNYSESPKKPNKKLIILSVIAALIVLAGIGIFVASRPDSKPVAAKTVKTVKKVEPPKPKTVPSILSGLEVDPSLNQKTVTGVMVENSTAARPQAGLGQAGVVFEAIAEGGITRFLALYQDTAPENVGPIRSARPYYVQWAMGFDAGYAHVGGSPEALASIRTWGARDLDQFFNAGAYHRIAERAAPHNVYTSIAALNQLESAKGYATSTYTGFPRKKPTPSKAPTAKTIDFKISGPIYNVHYDYNPATNSYNRSVGGAPHIDANTNSQLSPKVVVAIVMPYGLAGDGYHSIYQSLGSGQAYIFQDGNVTIGSWSKPDVKSQITFTDANGKPIPFNPGQTWLTALGSNSAIAYTP